MKRKVMVVLLGASIFAPMDADAQRTRNRGDRAHEIAVTAVRSPHV